MRAAVFGGWASLALTACIPSTVGTGAVDSSSSESEGDGAVETEGCPVGSLDCPCTPGGGCDPGAACEDGVCREAPGDSGAELEAGDEDPDEGDDASDCTELGCACDGGRQSCDPPLECVAGECVESSCGNGIVEASESCDDGNDVDGDGCDNDCTATEMLSIVAGEAHTCVLIEGGRVRCWGVGDSGRLGYENKDSIGDDETPASAGDVPLPEGRVVELTAGFDFTCARYDDGAVRCWGSNSDGQLGLASSQGSFTAADLADVEPIELGGPAEAIAAGEDHVCARLASGEVRCWGLGNEGRLGLGNSDKVGDNETPASRPALFFGQGLSVLQLAVGGKHGCVLTDDLALRCWGRGWQGQLGYGSGDNVGDNEVPAEAGAVSVIPEGMSAAVDQLALFASGTCVRLSSGEARCWGRRTFGTLGQDVGFDDYGNDPDELPSALSAIEFGASVVSIHAGSMHMCAVLDGGALRCWGRGSQGELGDPNALDFGPSMTPLDVADVALPADVLRVALGGFHSCALVEGGELYCWGFNGSGRLGLATTEGIVGDDEAVTAFGPVTWL